jgi:hypothetical protein
MTGDEYTQHRSAAERSCDGDLKKPLRQLVADIHDESARTDRDASENLVHLLKRFAAVAAIASESSDRASAALTDWTKRIAWLTVAVVFLTACLIYFAWRTDGSLREMASAYEQNRVAIGGRPQDAGSIPTAVRSAQSVPGPVVRDSARPPLPVVPSAGSATAVLSRIPTQSPPTAPPEWHDVTTFVGGDLSSAGSSPETDTSSFVVGDRWRMVWRTRSGNQGSLTVFIQDVPGGHGDASEGGMAFSHSGQGSGDELKYGAGEYYLHILANEPYLIHILSR